MKLKKIKFENIYLLFIILQFIHWVNINALSKGCIVYYTCVIIAYFTIRYLRRFKED